MWVWVLLAVFGVTVTVAPVFAALVVYGVARYRANAKAAEQARQSADAARIIQQVADELTRLQTDGITVDALDDAAARMEAAAVRSPALGVKACMCFVRAQMPYLRAATLAREAGHAWPGLASPHVTTTAQVDEQIAVVTRARDANIAALARAEEIEPQARRCFALHGDDGAAYEDGLRRMKVVAPVHRAGIAAFDGALGVLAVLKRGGYTVQPNGELAFVRPAQAREYDAAAVGFDASQRDVDAATEAARAVAREADAPAPSASAP